jgi:hypothetical protein
MIQVVIDVTTNNGAIRLWFVDRRQRDWLLRLQKATELLEGGHDLRQPQDRYAMSIADRYRILSGLCSVFLDDETVDQFDGSILRQEPCLDGR